MYKGKKLKFTFTVLFALGIVITACNRQDATSSLPISTSTATSYPSPTNTVEPTITLSATNTATLAPTKTPKPKPTHTPTIAPTTTVTTTPTASSSVSSETEIVGITFQNLPGFHVEKIGSQTNLISEDGKIVLAMIADYANEEKSLQEMLDEYIKEIGSTLDEFNAAESYFFSIGDNNGLAVDVTGKFQDYDLAGKIAVVIPENGQVFMIFGSAIDGLWESDGVDAFDTFISSLAFEHPENEANSSNPWDNYQPRTLDELDDLTGEALADTLNEDDGELPIIYLEYAPDNQYPSRVQAVFTGQFRDTPEDRMTGITMWMATFLPDLTPEEVAELFAKEGLFTDGSNQYWMPVQNFLIPTMEDELSPGDEIELLVRWMGAVIDSGQIEKIYLVNAFKSPE